MTTMLQKFKSQAQDLDANDPLKRFKVRFTMPEQSIYLCNNSLGLPAADAFPLMEQKMKKWSELGAEAWFHGQDNWYSSLDDSLRMPLANILGASKNEVIVMNSLTVNLHLLMVTFYKPTKKRYKIVIDAPTFPSDLYAMKSQIAFHGFDPDEGIILLEPRAGEHLLRHEDIASVIEREGESIALVCLSGVNFLTGQVFDMEAITQLAKRHGCVVGFDIAHAAGNIPLKLHDWNVDFAVGCSYKYLCSGPGGPGIAYVHDSHHKSDLPRFSGWWGNDPKTNFQMHLQSEFVPHDGVYSWQVSTPSILAMTPLVASLSIFKEAGMDALRQKSELQAQFLMEMLKEISFEYFEVITPHDPKKRGCQLSLLLKKNGKECQQYLHQHGIICDFREPNVIRVTPSPLYNTFDDLYDFVVVFNTVLDLMS